jgi:hypothetical protein
METLSGETMYGAKGGLPGSGVAGNDRCRIEQVDESPKQEAKIVVNAEGAGTVKVHADVVGQRTQGGKATPFEGVVHAHQPRELDHLGRLLWEVMGQNC